MTFRLNNYKSFWGLLILGHTSSKYPRNFTVTSGCLQQQQHVHTTPALHQEDDQLTVHSNIYYSVVQNSRHTSPSTEDNPEWYRLLRRVPFFLLKINKTLLDYVNKDWQKRWTCVSDIVKDNCMVLQVLFTIVHRSCNKRLWHLYLHWWWPTGVLQVSCNHLGLRNYFNMPLQFGIHTRIKLPG